VIVLSHRGYWKEPAEKNGPVAFQRSFDLGYGTETDVRDLHRRLVIAHDPPDGSEMMVDALLDLLAGRDLPLAMNIKADGNAQALHDLMRARGVKDWFTFDMTVPELVVQLRLGLPAFTRASEYEQPCPCYDRAAGVWVDGFERTWFTAATLETFLRDGKRVAVVSPELHGRDPMDLWPILRRSAIAAHPALMLCTDLPERASAYFGDGA
jgi:hypothetical protein